MCVPFEVSLSLLCVSSVSLGFSTIQLSRSLYLSRALIVSPSFSVDDVVVDVDYDYILFRVAKGVVGG